MENHQLSDIVSNLRSALAQAEAERDAELDAVRLKYQADIDAIKNSIAVLTGQAPSNGNGLDAAPHTELAVSPEKMDQVRKYLKRHRKARQADIAKALSLNSGSVSVALRRLQILGEAKAGPKQDGSRIWESVRDAVPAITA